MRTRMLLAGAGVVLMGSLSSVVAFTSPAVGGLRPRPLGQSTQQRACRWPSLRRSVLPMKAIIDPATVQATVALLNPSHLAAISPETMAAIHALPDVQGVMNFLADAAVVADAAAAAAAPAEEASPGMFGMLVNVIVYLLTSLHDGLKAAGVPGAWGLSIALFTVGIKTLTYPLNYKQMSSTMALQAVQPKMKAIQARYANDPQKMNEMIAQLYQEENVNPLAGCLPTLVQIPVFIGLYRSVLTLAQKDLLEESFLWIPSLQGPVGEYNMKTGLPIDPTGWLFKGWVDGHPAMGWEATAAYLSLPVILVITQSLSQKILQPPPSDDPAQQQTQQILKFLPLMIGWFALNVPAGLGIYWVFNNAITTSQGWYIRQQFKPAGAAAGSTGSTGSASSASSMFAGASSSTTITKPKTAAKPVGFLVDERLPKLDTASSSATKDKEAGKDGGDAKAAAADDDKDDGEEEASKSAAKKKAKAMESALKKKKKN